MSGNTSTECRSRSCAVSMNSSLSSPSLDAKIIKGSRWKRWNSAGLQGDTWPSMKEFLLQRDEEAVGEFKLLVCSLQRPRRIKWLTLIYFNDLNNNTQNSHLIIHFAVYKANVATLASISATCFSCLSLCPTFLFSFFSLALKQLSALLDSRFHLAARTTVFSPLRLWKHSWKQFGRSSLGVGLRH